MPEEPLPLKKAQCAFIRPAKFGVINHPEKSQPPLYEVFDYAIEHFREFLELVAWAGKEFGAIQVKVPSQEEDSSW